MARPQALLKKDVPDTVLGEIAIYLHDRWCAIPGCKPVFHLEEAEDIIQLILDYNRKKKEGD